MHALEQDGNARAAVVNRVLRSPEKMIGTILIGNTLVDVLASGLASTSVGAYAGAEIMQGLLRVRVPLLARRLVTLIPALILRLYHVTDATLTLFKRLIRRERVWEAHRSHAYQVATTNGFSVMAVAMGKSASA